MGSRLDGAQIGLGGQCESPGFGVDIVSREMTGPDQCGLRIRAICSTEATAIFSACTSVIEGEAAGDYAQVSHFSVCDFGLGAGATLDTQIGVAVNPLTAGYANMGFRSQVDAGAHNWNLFFDGTAHNYINGNLLLGQTNDQGSKLQVGGYTGTYAASTGMGVNGNSEFQNAVKVGGAFGCNGKSPQGAYTLAPVATDLASAIALANSMRAALIANGIGA